MLTIALLMICSMYLGSTAGSSVLTECRRHTAAACTSPERNEMRTRQARPTFWSSSMSQLRSFLWWLACAVQKDQDHRPARAAAEGD